MHTIKNIVLLFLGFGILITIACKKDKKSGPTVPELTTADVTDPTSSTAIAGGTIVSNGGETITISGVCWSKTNPNPTIADDTTKGTTASGSFTTVLKNLNSNSTYYVRAYATNRIGTGYGAVKQFTTSNAAPTATNIEITGSAEVNKTVTATYTYTDSEGDLQGASTFQWYSADNAAGDNEVLINGATALTFTVQEAQQGKYIRIGIKPKAVTGTIEGLETKSNFAGAVGEATTVTFMYNGAEVIYGILNSSTGKKWLDRNLGASQLAGSVNDYHAYGDMFQWGRAADGHQLVSRTGVTVTDVLSVNGMTSTTPPYQTSSNDNAGTNKFIYNGSSYDWRIPQNSDLWQGTNGVNNPCPSGWRVPTEQEWKDEGIASISDAYTKLKLTYSGFRDVTDGAFYSTTTGGYYWSSTTILDQGQYSFRVRINASSLASLYIDRGNAMPVRCIK